MSREVELEFFELSSLHKMLCFGCERKRMPKIERKENINRQRKTKIKRKSKTFPMTMREREGGS